MSAQFEPTDQRVAFVKFQFIRFRQTAKTGAEPVGVALASSRTNPDTTDARCISGAFHDRGNKRFDIVEAAKDAWESQQLKCVRRARDGSRRRLALGRYLRGACRC